MRRCFKGYGVETPRKLGDVATRLETRSYDDLESLLSDVDAVAIAVPPYAQAELAVRAAEAGCHLLLEKPLSLSVAEAKSVVDAVDNAGVASVVFFTGRFLPHIEGWIQSAASAGPWHSANYVLYGNIFQPGSPYLGSKWRREYGVLWDVGPHMLSFIVPVMGPVSSVTAAARPRRQRYRPPYPQPRVSSPRTSIGRLHEPHNA